VFVIFWRGDLCGVQMSLTLVFSDDLSDFNLYTLKGGKVREALRGLVTIDPGVDY
jgi:hypothetical protein